MRVLLTYMVKWCKSGIIKLVIVQYRVRAHPVALVIFFQVTEKGRKRLTWTINLLLDVYDDTSHRDI